MSRVTVIIPCYNEESRLPVDEYRRYLSSYPDRLVFVNDGSVDHTLQVLKELQLWFPGQVHILNLTRNVGKAEAIRWGMLKVASETDNGIIGFMDADLATPFSEIDYFLDAFNDGHLKFVFGSRIARVGADIQRYQARHYFGRVVATLVSNYLRLPVNDSQCGAKFFQADFARRLFADPFVSRWLFDVEIFKRISLMHIAVESCSLELPLHTWIEKGGSKLTIQDLIRLPWEFCKIMNYYAEKENSADLSLLYEDIAAHMPHYI